MADTSTDYAPRRDYSQVLHIALMYAERERDQQSRKVSPGKYADPGRDRAESDQDYISTTPVGGA